MLLAVTGAGWMSCFAADVVDQPIPPSELEPYMQGMLSGEYLSYGLYGKRPIRWLPKATGDEMLRLARQGEFPDDESFLHVSFVYGSYWQNCRRYYMAYRITGDLRFVEQLCRYARLMEWILSDRPWLVLPQDQRWPRPGDPVATIPHEPAAASNFIGYALAARVTMQIARRDPIGLTPARINEARRFLRSIVKYMDSRVRADATLLKERRYWIPAHMDSRVRADGTIDSELGIPAAAADVIRTTPYNQSFMYFAVLAATAVALEDLQHLDGSEAHAQTIDLYTRIVRAGIEKFIDHSDVTEIHGRPYVFHSHTPADRYEQIRDPSDRNRRIPWIIDGHPVFHYPEDVPHSQSQAWNLVFIWEMGRQFGVTERLLKGVANTHVDYVLRGEAPLKGGEVGPPNHILSPWTLAARKNVNWSPLGRPALVYAIYLPFRGDIAEAIRRQSGRGKKEMDAPGGRQYVLFAHYLHARRRDARLLHLSQRR